MSLRSFIKRLQLLLEQGLYESRRAMAIQDDYGDRPLQITPLEERILMSASPVAVAEAPSTETSAVSAESAPLQLNDQQLLDVVADSTLPETEATVIDLATAQQTLELVFLDSSLSNIDQMIADLQSEDLLDASRTLEIVVLDAQRDGIAQITSALLNYDSIDGLHIVSHGNGSQVQLGSLTLSLENVDTYRSTFAAWQNSLSDEADLLFYGCNLASTDEGRELMRQIAAASDCDVSASEDLTGHESLGGDWDLEYQHGSVETQVAFSADLQSSWMGFLGTTTFQQGDVNAYAGTQDTELDSGSPDTNKGANVTIGPDLDDGSGVAQGLIRFDSFLGAAANQVPQHVQITSASLTVEVTGDTSGTISLHRMLQTWSESSTWNSLTGGLTANDTELAITPDSQITGALGTRVFTGLESTVQEWVTGHNNYGWGILNSSTDGWDMDSSEGTTPPILSVSYIDPGSQASVAHTLTVDTASDVWDGNTTSIDALLADKGADGFISLREAIWAANNTTNFDVSTPDTINFAIGAVGSQQTITLADTLPALTDPVMLDAMSQGGVAYGGDPLIRIDASSTASFSTAGIIVWTSDSTVRGFVVTGSDDEGIEVAGSSEHGAVSGNVIENNWVGVDFSGVAAANADNGILVVNDASNTIIRNNVVAGNTGNGIEIRGVGVNGTIIEGNMVGVRADGSTVVANSGHGIRLATTANNTRIGTDGNGTNDAAERNIISGNTGSGIHVEDVDGTTIAGNYIGISSSGTVDKGNTGDGISVAAAATNVTIGTAGFGNVISGNSGHGIDITDGSNITIQANTIGANAAGTAAIRNDLSGINVASAQATSNIQVGGMGVGEGNLIAYNYEHGILTSGAGSGDSIQGNTITQSGYNGIISNRTGGMDIIGNTIYSNSTRGVYDEVAVGADHTLYHNTIHGSQGDGLSVEGANAVIRNNIITGSAGFGINVNGAGAIAIESHNLITDAVTGPGNLGGRANVGLAGTTINADPLYVNAPAADFSLTKPGSPAIDAGIDLGVNQPDMNGATAGNFHDAAPDMGAIEAPDTPSVTTTGSALAYAENDIATNIDPGISIVDAENTIASATVQITTGYDSAQDVLSVVNRLGISGSWDSGTGTLTLSGSTTLANYQDVLRTVKYQNISDAPTASRVITFTVNDGTADSNTATRTVNITATNDTLLLGTSSGTLSYTENDAATAIDAGLTISNPDDTDLTTATVTISANYQLGEDELAFTNQLGITGSWDSGTGVLTLSGATSAADYQTALRTVTYENLSDTPSELSRTITFSVGDGTDTSIAGVQTALISSDFSADADGFVYADDTFGTSDPAKADGTYQAAMGKTDGGLLVQLGPGANTADVSGGWSKDFTLSAAGDVLITLDYRMWMGAGYETNEYGEVVLTIDGTRYGPDTNTSLLHMVGNNNGGGTEDSGWLSSELRISLGSGLHTLTLGAYNNLATAADEWTEVVFDNVVVGDVSSDKVVSVTAVNDVPTLTTFAAVVDTTNEDVEVELTFAELAAQGDEADVDGTVDAFIVKSVTSGTLKIGTSAGTATAWAATTNDTINATLKAYWTPAADANGTQNAFQVVAQDDDGGESASNVTVQVSVTDVNDIPTLTTFAAVVDTTNEDVEVELTFAELVAQGDEADVDGTVDAFIVKSVTSGTLKIGTSAGTATAWAAGTNDTINATLKAYWTPAADANGTQNAFEVVAQDDDGGESASNVTVQVSVSDVNDIPTLTTFAAVVDTTNEDVEVELTFAELVAQGDEADVDGTVDAFIVKSVTTGTLKIGTSAGTATAWAAGTNDTINATLKAYWTPASNANGTLNAFQVVAQDDDGGESASNVTVQVSVTDVNDIPTLTTFAAVVDTTNEDTEVELTFAELLAQGDEADVDGTVDAFIVKSVTSGTLKIGTSAGTATAWAATTNDTINATLKAYWTPAADANGTQNAFQVVAQDDDGGESASNVTVQVSVTDVNDIPTLTTFAAVVDATNEDTEVELTFAELLAQGDEADVDGTVDAFIVKSVTSGTLKIGTSAGTATAWAAGTNDTINATLKAYWTPASNANGTLNAFQVVAQDDDGGESASNVTVQVSVTDVNDIPTLTTFAAVVDTTNEDTEVELTFAELLAQGDEADVDGTVDAFIVKSVTSGTLKIGTSAGTATAWAATTNDTINATLKAYWTPAANANGTQNAFQVVAQDDDGGESASNVTVQVSVTDVNDIPTLTTFAAVVDTTNEDTELELTFAELVAQGDEADVDGTVDAFIVKSVTSGTLKIGTSAGTATAWAAGTNDTIDATNKAYWTPAADVNGTLNAFAVVARDNQGAESASSITVQVSVTSVGGEPKQTVPSAQNVNEDETLTFNIANGNAVSVSDTGPDDTRLQVFLSVNDGILTLSQTTGLTILSGSNGSSLMTIHGTESDLNAALEDMTFTPDADFAGAVNLQMTTSLGADLVGHYTFDAGDATDDSAGTAQNGTLLGGATTVTDGTRGEVLSLDGTNDTVRMSSTFGDPTSVTLAGWVNLNNVAGNDQIFTIGNVFGFELHSTNGVSAFFYDGTTINSTTSGVLLEGTGWHHVAYSVDDATSTQTIYVDGAAVATTGYTTTADYGTSGSDSHIGSNKNSSKFFNGLIDDARIYTRALSADEILNLASDNTSTTDNVSITVNDVNDIPTLTTFAAPVDTTNEDTEVELTFAELVAQGDEADVDGTVDAFIVKSVTTGTLKIGTSAGTATAWAASTNDTINATLKAYWTPAANANGTQNAFQVVAQDDDGGESASNVTVQVSVTDVNDIPTLTTFAAVVDTTNEDTEVELTFAELVAQGDEADVDGTVDAFIVKSVTTGTLKIGTSAGTATAWAAITNDTIDSTNKAYWTPAGNANGTLNAFQVVAQDDDGGESASNVTVQVAVSDVNDLPTLTTFAAVVDTTNEDTEVELTLAELKAQGDEADIDGTVDAFIIKSIASGSLKIGTSAGTATAWVASTNDTIDATNHAYWTPASDSNGTLNAFAAVAQDNDGGESATNVTAQISVTAVNDDPVITSNGGAATAAVNVDENTSTVTTVTSSDVDGGAPQYSVSGADSALFTIGTSSGVLAFAVAPDYEAPADADGDNVYEVTVQVSDGATGTDTQAISVSVLNVIDTSFDGPSTLIYSQNGGTTPQASDFNGTDFSVPIATSNIDGPWRVIAGAESPDRDEKIVVGVDAAGNLSGQMWDGASWTALAFNDFATVTDSTKHGFAVQYEATSGDAILVWNNGTTGTAGLSYKVWNGTTWSATNAITTPVSGEPQQLQLAAAPDSDEMVLVGSNATNQDFALVWDGDSWGNAQTLTTVAGGSNTEVAVVYEHLTGDALVVYGDNTSSAHFRTWNGTTWSVQQDLTPPAGVTGQITWTSVAADPNSDRIAFAAHTDNDETWLAVWNGTAWADKLLASTAESTNTFLSVAVAFESQSGDLLAVYSENDNRISYRTWDSGSGWSAETQGVDLGNKVRTLALTSRSETNQIMLTALDDGADVNSPLWDGNAWSERNEVDSNSGETTAQPFLFLWDQNPDYLVAAANDTAFWFSTDGDVNSKGAAGLNAWTAGEVVALGDPDLQLEPVDGITRGTATSVFNLDNFGGDTKINALHYVRADIQVGSSNFDLFAGDVLFSTQDSETLISTNTLSVNNTDITVFRPDAAGDYSSGSFYTLLQNPTGLDLLSISLVEQNTTVGDITLQSGDFLMSTGTSLLLFETTDVGVGTTSGTVQTLLDGADTNVNLTEDITGVELYEANAVIGGHTISAGTIVLSVERDSSVGSNSLTIKKHDLTALNVTQTTLIAGAGNGAASAQLIMDGSDIGLASGSEKLSAFTATPNNQAPIDITPNSMSVNENTDTSGGYSVGALTTADVDIGETFTYAVVGGTDQAKFSIGGGSNDELILTDGTLNFEAQASYSVTIRVTDSAFNVYEENLTVDVNDLNEAPVITGGPDTAGLSETNAGLTSTGTLTVTDQDTTDLVTAAVDSVGVTGTGAGSVPLTLTNPILRGFLSVSPTAILDGTQTTAALTWDFNSSGEAFDFLATGETLILTYTVSATDDDGSPLSDTETVTITITGTNDIPTLTTFAAVVDTINEDTEVELTFAELVAQGDEADVDGTVDAFIVKSVTSGTLKIGTSAGTATAWAATSNDTINATLKAYWTPAADANGTLNAFQVVALDDDGGESASNVTVQVAVTDVNDIPTLTTFAAVVDTTNEDTEVELTFAELAAQGDEADVDGTVDGFIVKSVTTGTLKIGTGAGTATAWAAGTNDTINATLNAYWTPATNANGTENAFEVVAQDDDGGESASNVTVQVSVTDVNDIPTLTAFAAVVDTTNEDTEVELTFAELVAQGDEADVDGTVDAFIVKSVTSGTLKIGTSAGTATAWAATTNDTINATLKAYWTPANNANGTLNAFQVVAQDDDGGESASNVTVQVSVSDVNDIPTLTTFAAVVDTINEDTEVELTFAELLAQGDEADIDGSVEAFIVKSVTTGTLKIGTNAGTATAWAAGTNDTINATNKAYWTPASNANGTLNAFQVVAQDDDGGESASNVTVQVSVTDVNDIPTLTTFAAVVDTTNEDTEVELTFAELLAQGDEADVDGTVDAFIVKSVTTGTLKIGTSAGTATAWAATTNDTINATLKAYWTPANNANGTQNAFQVVAQDDDGGESASNVTVQVSVTDVNDIPTLTAFAAVVDTTNEDTEVELTFAELVAQGDEADVDGTVDAFIVKSVTSGTLKIGTSAGTATAWAATTNDTINATLKAYWTPAADANGTQNAFQVVAQDDDGGESASNVTVQVSVTDVNDIPTLTTFAAVVDTTNEDTEVEVTFAELMAQGDEADVDGTVDAFIVKSVTSGTLKIGTSAGTATAWAATTNDTINATLKAYWTPAADANGTQNAFQVVAQDDDGGESASNVTVQVSVTDVNDIPTLTTFAAVVDTTNEDTEVELTFAELLAQGDEADVDGTVDAFIVKSVTTGTLKIGTSAGTATAWAATTNDTINATLKAYWTPANNANGTQNAFQVVAQDDDGGESASNVTVQVSVTDVNDIPTLTTFAAVVDTTNEDTEVELTFAELVAQGDEADVDGTVDAFIVKSITTGTLKIGTSAGTATAWAASTNDTIDAINRAYWTPANNANGTLNAFQVVAQDDDGGESVSNVTVQVSVTDVNDIPTLATFAAPVDTTNEDTEVELTFAELLAQGDEADLDGTVDAFVVKSVTSGTLNIGTSAGTATSWAAGTNDTINATLKAYWTPAADANGTQNAFQVVALDDDGGESASNVTVQVAVTDVNDIPTLTTFAAVVDTTNEDTEVELTFAELAAQGDEADVDGTVDGFIVKSVTTGTLKIGTGAGTATAWAAGTNDTINATLNAYWSPATNANGTENAFEVVAQDDDGGESASNVTVQVSVTDVNDIPTLTAFAAVVDTTNEDTEVELTFAELVAQGDEADVDGTVDAFIVKSVTTGTLKIGTSAGTATAWAAGTNDTIDALNHAYWTPDGNANGTLNAFQVVAEDNDGGESASSVTVQVSVTDVNDIPTLTTFAAVVDTTNEDTEVELTFADLAAQGDEADLDGTVDAFVIKSIATGTLRIGTSAGAATAWAAGSNDTVDATNHAYWTPAANANGTLNAFAVVAKDNQGGESATNITVQVSVAGVNDAPTGGVTIDNTTPSQGDTLTASNTLADVDGMGTITYTWKADGSTVGTGSTYLLTEAEVGAIITVEATYTDLQGTNELVASTGTAAVTNVNDAPTGSVTIDNTTPAQGDTLTASNTLADADGLGTITYTWKADGSTVGAGTTYVVTEAEVGKVITVEASYTDGHGTNEAVSSAATAAVTNVNDTPTGSVSIDNTTPAQGDTLTASNTLTDADGLGAIIYTWKADGATVGTGATYVLTQAEVGKVITVEASYTDGHGTSEAVTSTATAAVTNVNDAPTGSVSIDNTTPAQGDTLTASNTLADADGPGTISYTWKADGSTVGTGATYVVTEAEVGKVMTVEASYTDGHGTSENVSSAATAAVTNVNDAPIGSVTIDNTTPAQGDTLTASNTLADADGLGAITYTWQADGSTVGTGATYVLTEAEVGTVITVEASYTDGHGTAEAVTSTATAAVTNVNDAPTGSVTIDNTTPAQGDTLTASNTLADADGLGAITYIWKADGSSVGTGATYVLTQAEVGRLMTVEASYVDGHGTSETVTSTATAAVTNVNDLPTGSVTISGTPAEDQVLTAANTLADADGMGAVSYQWQRNGSDIIGAVSTTYTLNDADVGSTITVVAGYTDGHGNPEAVTSSGTGPIINVNDAPVGLPTITGTATEDQLLTADTSGISDADGLGAMSYQWLRNGVAIVGATSNTYLLGDADVGTQISVEVAYTDGHATAEGPLTSAQTGPVNNVNDNPVGVPTITGLVQEDQTLTANTSSISDADGLGAFSYQWLRDGLAVSGATFSTYTTGDADVGAQMSVQVSYVDSLGTSEGPLTSVQTSAVVNVNDEETLTTNTGLTVNEGVVGTAITQAMLETTDIDNATSQIVYTLTTPPVNGILRHGGTVLSAGHTFSQLDVNTGLLSYDHSGSEVFADSFAFAVDDGSGTFSSGIFAVTVNPVNDNPPVIAPSQSFSVSEQAVAATSLGLVVASDIDTVGSLQNWAIVGGNSDGIFAIDSSTGEITVSDSTNLNFEARSSYTVTLTVSDGLNTSATQTVALSIIDENEAPVFVPTSSMNIDENSVNGSVVGTVVAHDYDRLDLLHYEIVSGSPGQPFWIDNGTGVISVADAAQLNFETVTEFSVSVRVTDTGGLTDVQTFAIRINDQDDVITDLLLKGNLIVPTQADNEDLPNTTAVIHLLNTEQTDTSAPPSDIDVSETETPQLAIRLATATGSSATLTGTVAPESPAQILHRTNSEQFIAIFLEEVPEGDGLDEASASKRNSLRSESQSGTTQSKFLFAQITTTNPLFGNTAFDLNADEYVHQQQQQRSDRLLTEKVVVGTTAAISTTVSIGYAVWMLRGGSLLTTFLSSLPVWQSFDPLPVLKSFEANGDMDGDDESLASLVSDAQ